MKEPKMMKCKNPGAENSRNQDNGGGVIKISGAIQSLFTVTMIFLKSKFNSFPFVNRSIGN